MTSQPKKSIKDIILLSLITVFVSCSAVFGFSMLVKDFLRLIANPVIYPSAWRFMAPQNGFSNSPR
jgi:hypothetical protein